MSAAKIRGGCPAGDPHRVRYRSRTQARKGLDRARVALTADGIPAELHPVGWHRCRSRADGGCAGWHLHVGAGARARFLGPLGAPTLYRRVLVPA